MKILYLRVVKFPNAVVSGRSPALSALAHTASVRLQLTRERWLRRHRDIRGYEARVQVLKNRLGPAGQNKEGLVNLIVRPEVYRRYRGVLRN